MFPYQITNKGVTIFIDGQPRQFAHSHGQYDQIVSAIHSGNEEAVRNATDVRTSIFKRTLGRVRVEGHTIFIDDKAVKGTLVDRILAMIAMQSAAVDGFIRLLDRIHLNLSKQTTEELFDFIEACDLPVTPDGCFLAYKYVTEDFKDCYTRSIDNSVGAKPRMKRNEVDDRRTNLCSTGLHVCSLDYLSSNYSNKKIVVVKVAPEDVVSVPLEYELAKMRTAGYEVVGVLDNYNDGERIKPWFEDKYEVEDDESEDDEVEVDESEDDEVEVDESILIFDPEAVQQALDAIGTDKAVILAYLEVLDNELVEEMYDYTVLNANGGGVEVTIWLDEDVIVLEHIVTPTEPTVKRSNAKLTVEQVREIKALKPDWENGLITLTQIGERYGVHREQIARIFRGETWKDVT